MREPQSKTRTITVDASDPKETLAATIYCDEIRVGEDPSVKPSMEQLLAEAREQFPGLDEAEIQRVALFRHETHPGWDKEKTIPVDAAALRRQVENMHTPPAASVSPMVVTVPFASRGERRAFWIWAVLVLLLLSVLAGRGRAQVPHDPIFVRGADEGTNLFTRAAGLVRWNCVGAGIVYTWTAATNTFTMDADRIDFTINEGNFVLSNLGGAVTDAQVPDTITIALAAAATALAANGANCSAGQFPLGVDASGASESCTALPTTISGTANEICVAGTCTDMTVAMGLVVALGRRRSAVRADQRQTRLHLRRLQRRR